jgi:hypothetical protein
MIQSHGAEGAVEAAALARVGSAVPPLLACGMEADALGHIVEEQPAGDYRCSWSGSAHRPAGPDLE